MNHGSTVGIPWCQVCAAHDEQRTLRVGPKIIDGKGRPAPVDDRGKMWVFDQGSHFGLGHADLDLRERLPVQPSRLIGGSGKSRRGRGQ
jgi:hypothetical protein